MHLLASAVACQESIECTAPRTPLFNATSASKDASPIDGHVAPVQKHNHRYPTETDPHAQICAVAQAYLFASYLQ